MSRNNPIIYIYIYICYRFPFLPQTPLALSLLASLTDLYIGGSIETTIYAQARLSCRYPEMMSHPNIHHAASGQRRATCVAS